MTDDKKHIGIIGGLGPMATVRLTELIVRHTPAARDQDHLRMTVLYHPQVPDRTACLLDRTKPSPVPYMTEDARELERCGADFIIAPCVTSHCFWDELSASTAIPWLNMIGHCCRHVDAIGAHTAGLLATDGTVKVGIFQSALAKHGVNTVLPDEEHQRTVMSLIYDDIKAGRRPDMDGFVGICRHMRARGADCVILGCTELPLLRGAAGYPEDEVNAALGGAPLIDTLDVLARAAVDYAVGRIGIEG